MRPFWVVVCLSVWLAPRAEAGFGGGTYTHKVPKIDLNPSAVGGDPLPPIAETADERFMADQADLMGTFADFVNPTDALAAEAFAAGRSSFSTSRSDEKKVSVAFEVVAKAFGVKFKSNAADPGVVVMDDPKDALPPVELYAGDTVTVFFQIDQIAPDGSLVYNRFGTEAVVVDTGNKTVLEATTVVASLGMSAGDHFVWSQGNDGRGRVVRAPAGVQDVSTFADLLAIVDQGQPEPYLFTFADVYPKGSAAPEYRAEDAVKGPGGDAVSLKGLPPHTQIRVTHTAHFVDDWQGKTAAVSNGSGPLSAEALADRQTMDALLGSWAGLGIQTGASPAEIVLDSRSEAPYAVPAEGTVVVLGAALAHGRTPSIHFSTIRVDILPDGRIYRTSLANSGSITVLGTKEGWTVVRTSSKVGGGEIFETTTYPSPDGAVGAVKAWFGGLGLAGDRLAVAGEDIAVLRPRDGRYHTFLQLTRNASLP